MNASIRRLSQLIIQTRPAAIGPAKFSALQKYQRCFATRVTDKLISSINSELQHEKANYQQPSNISPFLEKSGWIIDEKAGYVNMVLKKAVDNMKLTVEFQLVSPNYAAADEDEENENQTTPAESQDTTDFSVTCEKPDGQGAVFYCTTVAHDEKFRFVVGNVRYFATSEERTSVSAYNGPEFEDLDDNLQSGIDEWLDSLGINDELCDFVDAMAVDKEQREYIRWLECIGGLIQ